MSFNPDLHHRRSIRLKKFDYSQESTYFITICSYQKKLIFGEIQANQMILNPLGHAINESWTNLTTYYKDVLLDQFIIMPNHIHGIIAIRHSEYGIQNRQIITLGQIIRTFKSESTRKSNKIRNKINEPLWQRNYYEHIIRNEKGFNAIAEYIYNNPRNWKEDTCWMGEP